MNLVPSLMEIILPSLEKNLSWGHNPLKMLIFSGENLSILLWKRVHEILPETTIVNLYGTTEVRKLTTYISYYVIFVLIMYSYNHMVYTIYLTGFWRSKSTVHWPAIWLDFS